MQFRSTAFGHGYDMTDQPKRKAFYFFYYVEK